MTDIAINWDQDAETFDLAVEDNDIATDEGLRSAVVVSLFTDRLARTDDRLPDGGTDRRGWWGDVFPEVPGDLVGSRLWLLSREKQLPSVVARAEEYAREALAWMIEDRVADSVEVTGEVTRPGMLGLLVVINRVRGGRVDFRFDVAWQAETTREG